MLKEWWLPAGFIGRWFISPTTGKKVKEKQYIREIIRLLETKDMESMKKQTKPYGKSGVVIKIIVLMGYPSYKITEVVIKLSQFYMIWVYFPSLKYHSLEQY